MNTSDSSTPNRRLHPLIATAAGAIIVASLVATAAITGVFPRASSSTGSEQAQAGMVASQPVVDASQPANPATYAQQPAEGAPQAQAQGPNMPPLYSQQPGAQPAQPAQPAPQAQQAPVQQPMQQPQPAEQQAQQPEATQPAYCASCGTVVAVSAVRQEGHGTGLGAVGGAVAGGVIGNQFGAGGGRTAMTLLGALGGGFAGNSVEKHLRSSTSYSVRVHMENGKTRYFTYHEAPPFQQGQRVRVENGTLVAA